MGSLISIIKRVAEKRAEDYIDGDDEFDERQKRRKSREKWHAQQKERYWQWKENKRNFKSK